MYKSSIHNFWMLNFLDYQKHLNFILYIIGTQEQESNNKMMLVEKKME